MNKITRSLNIAWDIIQEILQNEHEVSKRK